MGFDLQSWLSMGEDRLTELEDKEKGIDSQIFDLEDQREEIHKERQQILEALGRAESTPKRPVAGKRIMIRPLLLQVLHETEEGQELDIDDLIEKIREDKPNLQYRKIHDALLRLSKDDERVKLNIEKEIVCFEKG